LFVERFVERPRHVEVQVLADQHGAVVHLGERECSLQRRHQKVIEESPSPLIDDITRERLGAAAISAARSVDYSGVGTVEFIVASAHPDQFFFMEMNTRLQVEHPVTEMVTGLDLVEQQLRVACGEHLEDDVLTARMRGHSFEARIYAESPSRGFLPTSGRVLEVHEPAGEGVRVDSALLQGLEVAADYDPMLAKIVTWGPDRASALARLAQALEDTVIFGVVTNVDFLGRLVAERRRRRRQPRHGTDRTRGFLARNERTFEHGPRCLCDVVVVTSDTEGASHRSLGCAARLATRWTDAADDDSRSSW
jgi:acetyl-CoA/propionyl-CoA carboxylase biotin carboxyl carrier protein